MLPCATRIQVNRYILFNVNSFRLVVLFKINKPGPSDYDSVLKHYTLQGYRVLALAAKALSPDLTWADVQRMPREEVEMSSKLVGLLIFQNGLKKETIPSIKELEDANLYTMMVTGDNLQTAITVAKDCTMIHSTQKIIQVKAAILPSLPEGDAQDDIQMHFVDPLSSHESTIERVILC